MQTPDLSVVMPAYNEASHLEKNITSVAQTLGASAIAYELIVVDNGSTDETQPILARLAAANPRIMPVSLAQNAGYGGGIRAGFAHARGTAVGWMDADGQESPQDIVRVYHALVSSGAGLAKAVRRIRKESAFRRVQSGVFNFLFWVLFGSYTRDINAKPKVMTRAIYERLHLVSDDWFIDAELVIQLKKLGAPVAEVSIEWNERIAGKSHVHVGTALKFIYNMIAYRLWIH